MITKPKLMTAVFTIVVFAALMRVPKAKQLVLNT